MTAQHAIPVWESIAAKREAQGDHEGAARARENAATLAFSAAFVPWPTRGRTGS